MVGQSLLTRDGFHGLEDIEGLKPGEEDLRPLRAKSSEVARIRIVGETMLGQVIKHKVYPDESLHRVRLS